MVGGKTFIVNFFYLFHSRNKSRVGKPLLTTNNLSTIILNKQ